MKKDIKSFVKNLPEEIILDAMHFASDCSVALVGYSENNTPLLDVIASGTLISIQDRFGVLTAKHVWEMFKDHKDVHKIHFSILGYRHFIGEPKEFINPLVPDPKIDICFLELSPNLVSTIKAYRMFYPIKQENVPTIDKIKDNLWLTVGFPAEMKSDEKKVVIPLRYFTNLVDYNSIENGYDEIELIVDYEDSNKGKIPLTFGGMSGGGIWNFKIYYNDDTGETKYFTGKSVAEKLLVGVNYWETPIENGKRRVKGIGFASIYQNLFDAVGALSNIK